MSWHVPPWVCPAWDSLHFLDLGHCFLFHVKEVFSYYLLRYFLRSFPSLLLLGFPSCKCAFNVAEFSWTVLISFHSFLFRSLAVISTILSFDLVIHSSTSVICSWSLLVFLSCRILHCSFLLAYSFGLQRLVKHFCVFLVCVSFPSLRSWIIFAILPLNYFSGMLPVSNSLSCSSGVLSCSFLGDIVFTIPSCLTFCECGFWSGCRLPCLFLPSAPWARLVSRRVQASVRGPGSRPLMAGAGSCASGGQGCVKGCVEWAAVGLGRLRAARLPTGRAVFPCVGCSAWGQHVSRRAGLCSRVLVVRPEVSGSCWVGPGPGEKSLSAGGLTAGSTTWSSAPRVCPCHEPHPPPSTGRPAIPAARSGSGSREAAAFPGSWCPWDLCVPPEAQFLRPSALGTSCDRTPWCSGGASPQPDPQAGAPSLRTFPAVWRPLWWGSSARCCTRGGYGSWPFHSRASPPSSLWFFSALGKGSPSVDGAAGLGAGGRLRLPHCRAGCSVRRLWLSSPMTATRKAARMHAPPPQCPADTQGPRVLSQTPDSGWHGSWSLPHQVPPSPEGSGSSVFFIGWGGQEPPTLQMPGELILPEWNLEVWFCPSLKTVTNLGQNRVGFHVSSRAPQWSLFQPKMFSRRTTAKRALPNSHSTLRERPKTKAESN